MITELDIMCRMVNVIGTQLNGYLAEGLPEIVPAQVGLDIPEPDKMAFDTMFYVLPDYAEYEEHTTESDRGIFRLTVFILCRRDTQANLTEKSHGYYNALRDMLRKNTDLDGMVDFTFVENTNFYPAVDANPNVKGVEASVRIDYELDF